MGGGDRLCPGFLHHFGGACGVCANHTIEDVTSGYVKRKAVGAALSIGVGQL